ncbi:MAG: hypothetical protein WCP35_03495 [Verrucomicrobiota bacterium]
MPAFFILRQVHTDISVFEAVKPTLRQNHLWESEDGEIKEWVALPQGTTGGGNFDRAAAFVSARLKKGRELIALVDEVDPSQMNPLMSKGWSTLIAMLVLAFPEVRWHFLVVTGRPDMSADDQQKSWDHFSRLHGVGSLTEPRGTALFDGYGLRQHIRKVMKIDRELANRPENNERAVPTRPDLAVVLDDESGFSRFCGLMAFRSGFRVHAIASWREAERLLGKESPVQKIALSIEDWYLGFPDGAPGHLSDMEERQRFLPTLGSNPPPIRRFITVGHDRQKETEVKRRAYLRDLRLNERLETGRPVAKSRQVVYKPASGLHTLWDKLGFLRAFPKNTTVSPNSVDYRYARGLANGYIWPPPKPDAQGLEDTDGHSSLGRFLQIAEHLIHRATKLLEEVSTVSGAVRGAVLATQALELLGGKTPTVAVDALALKHEFEVVAECQFVGVEFHLSMNERLTEIRKNLDAMKHWLHKDRREAFLLNSEARIVKRIISVLDEYGEYEESVTCQNRLRWLHRKIRQHDDWRRRKVLKIALWPLNTYLEWVQRSFIYFFGTFTVCISLFTCGFYAMASPKDRSWSDALHTTVQAMHTVALPDLKESKEASVTIPNLKFAVYFDQQPHQFRAFLSYFTSLFGVTNFGIFISMLYSRISRK